ncbi:MAG: hypothetical protein LBH82_05000 [Bacteroidales bacterium]|jgi:hypothetical protein|nr:hypothetical protein [Bacteroidales bacterium]
MPGEPFIPRKDIEFHRWVNNFMNCLSEKQKQFHFPEEAFEELEEQCTDFNTKFMLSKDPGTRTPVAVQAKTSSRKLLEKSVRMAIKEYLFYNHFVSDEDRFGLGIPIHKTTRTPSPIAAESPDVDVDTSVLGRITVHFYERGHRHKKAKPAGQHAVEIVWNIRDTPPTRWDELLYSAVDTGSPHTFSFENDQRGKTVYFALRWENTRGEKGPWSTIHSAIIP